MLYLQKNFNYLKNKMGLTFATISEETGVNPRTLVILANQSDKNMRIEVVMKLAAYFYMTIDELIYDDLEALSSGLQKDDIVSIIACYEARGYKGEKWKIDFETQLKDSYRIENLTTGKRDTYNKVYLKKVD